MEELTERKYTESYYSDKFLAGGSELFTSAGKSGYEVRLRTPSYKKFRAVQEACRRVLDGKENENG